MKTIAIKLLFTSYVLLLMFFLLDATFPFLISIPYSKQIVDSDGKLCNAYLSSDDKWRIHCHLNDVNPLLLKTIIEKEDKYFQYHFGINPFAITRAAFNNLTKAKRTSGASTITMQVVRLLEKRKRNILSKLIEAFRALQLEFHFSKNEILELYINNIPFGGNIEGVKAASLIYFERHPKVLSDAETVCLTIIPNRPSSLKPNNNNSLLIAERNKWLKRLALVSIIHKNDLNVALNEPVKMSRHNLPNTLPHLARRLSNNNQSNLIQTTIKSNIQSKVSQLTQNHIDRIKGKGIHNASVLVIDNETRNMLAYIGNYNYNDAQNYGQVDGVKAIRSPGSTLKPLVYALAIDKGIITPATRLMDVPINIDGYAPENYDKQFSGSVSASDALAASLNIPAVELLDSIGVGSFTNSLITANFKSIRKSVNQLGLSTILGGCGVSLEELAGLYAAFASDGKYLPIQFIKSDKITVKPVQICSEDAAYLLSNILSKTNRPDLPNLFDNSINLPKIAWKTGTSYGRRDAWSIGYNKQYTVAVWIGNFDGKGIAELSGAETATPLLFQIINSISYQKNNKWFTPTKQLDLRYVCATTGLKTGEYCTDKIFDYYLPGTSSEQNCNHLIKYYISPDERFSYCLNCKPNSGYKEKLFENLNPELINYYHELRIPFESPPIHNLKCENIFEGKAPVILSPDNKQEYLIEKAEPKKLLLKASASADVKVINWYINDQFYKTINIQEPMYYLPEAGENKITCVDDKGRKSEVNFIVTYY